MVTFRDHQLLAEALIHRSYLNEHPDFELQSNERLEFLGDALIGIVIAEALHQHHSRSTEGELTERRVALVRKENLAELAQDIDLGQFLRMGQGEENSGGRARESNLASCFEALMGAVFLDQGYDVARTILLRLMGPVLGKVNRKDAPRDVKSRLQELIQQRGLPAPRYQIVKVSGPEHAREFMVEVWIDDQLLGCGKGHRKSQAEKQAAEVALQSFTTSIHEGLGGSYERN